MKKYLPNGVEGLFSFSKTVLSSRGMVIRLSLVIFLVISISVLLAGMYSGAEAETGNIPAEITLKDVESGSLLFKTDKSGKYIPAPVLRTEVEMQITGIVLRAKVKQIFRNSSDSWVEGVYVFPLPENSAVDRMRMKIGERIIEGQIKERQEAKKIYEKAKREGKKASLVEQERSNTFTNSVANIGPGEEIEIMIEYQQELKYDSGKFSFRFPMVIAPRFIPGSVTEVKRFSGTGWAKNTNQVPDASRITPPVIHPDNGKINPVSIDIELNTGFSLKHVMSLYHEINMIESENHLYNISLKEGDVPADSDFVLEWEPDVGRAPNAALFTEMKDGEKYVLLMVMPPNLLTEEKVRIPRETIFIIDSSGSMGGTSIRQARKALLSAVERLQPEDKFNIIEFNSYTRKFYPTSLSADEENIENAKSEIKRLKAGGGTVMMPVLKAALENQNDDGRVRQVIFITDGAVGNETSLFNYIKYNLGTSRLFTIGIGSAPNSHFMSKAAEFGKGTFTYIGSISEVEEKMSNLFSKIESPYLSEITVSWKQDQSEMFPGRIPDLYKGQPVIISAKLVKTANSEMTISGKRGKQPWKVNLNLEGGRTHSGIGQLWARKKISKLMDKYHDNYEDEFIRQDIVELALKHHLVSKFTSLVAVDMTPTRPEEEEVKTKALPTNLPKGWKYEKVFGSLPQTATPARLYMLIGSLLALLSLLVKFGLGRR